MLAEVAFVALEALVGELAHVQAQHAVGELVGERRHARERDLEVEQLDLGRDRELEVERDEQQVDLEVGEQLQEQPPRDVENRQGRQHRLAVAELVQEVVGDLVEPDPAVLVRVVQEHEGLEADAQPDPGLGEADVELGRGRDARGELEDRLLRVEVQAVEQRERIAEPAVEEVAQAERVVAEGRRIDDDSGRDPERDAERAVDREELRVGELERELGQVDLDDRDVVAHQQAEDLARVLEQREADEVAEVAVGQAVGEATPSAGSTRARRRRGRRRRRRCRRRRCRAAIDRAAVEVGVPQAVGGVGAEIDRPLEEREVAERQDQRGIVRVDVRDAVDERDDVGDRVDQVRVDEPGHAGEVDERDVAPGEVRDHRDRRGDDVDYRLERLGELLHLVDDRRQELGDEAAEVEADVAELDHVQALGDRVADVAEADQLARVAVADVPVEEEVADDLREHVADRARHQLAVELELQPEVDDRLGGDADVEAEVAEVADAEQRVARPALPSPSSRKMSTPNVAPRPVAPLLSASSCRNSSLPVSPASGSVTSMLSSNSFSSEVSM